MASINAYPFPGYNFCVYMDAVKIGFQSVSGLTLKKDSYAAFHEGGSNFSIEMHREEKKEPNRLVLSKGLGFFNPSKSLSKIAVLLLVVHDERHKPIHAYYFTNAYVEQVTVSEFDAEQSRALIDTTTIIYDSAIEVDLSRIMDAAAYLNRSSSAQEEGTAANPTVERIRKHNEEVREKLGSKNEVTADAPIER